MQGNIKTNSNYELAEFESSDFEIVKSKNTFFELKDKTVVYHRTPHSLVVQGDNINGDKTIFVVN